MQHTWRNKLWKKIIWQDSTLFFSVFFLPLRIPICCSFCSAHWPSATPQCCLFFLFFWLPSLGGWGKMTVTLAIDSTLTHQAPTLARHIDSSLGCHKRTQNWGPHKFEKWNSLPLNWLTCFSGLCFPEEGVRGWCICMGKGLLVNYMHIYKLVLKSMELWVVCLFLLLLLLFKKWLKKSNHSQYYPKMPATSRQKAFCIRWYN